MPDPQWSNSRITIRCIQMYQIHSTHGCWPGGAIHLVGIYQRPFEPFAAGARLYIHNGALELKCL